MVGIDRTGELLDKWGLFVDRYLMFMPAAMRLEGLFATFSALMLHLTE